MHILKVILAAICCLGVLSPAAMAETTGEWRLDGTAEAVLPRNFRLCTDAFRGMEGDVAARQGLDTLGISGSGQPSAAAMPLLYARLKAAAPAGAVIYMVDLRQESHGYVDGVPVSWYELHNWANNGLTVPEVEADESARLSGLVGQEFTAVPLGNSDTKVLTAYTGIGRSVQTEKEAAEQAGFRYVRFAATDQVWPAPEAVDSFLRFYQSLPAGPVWLHFHCHAGHGRTTSFMVMYDILRNPGLSLETIAQRQWLLGGANLLAGSLADNWQAEYANDRAAKLRLFYVYVQEQRPAGFAVSWADWLAAQ